MVFSSPPSPPALRIPVPDVGRLAAPPTHIMPRLVYTYAMFTLRTHARTHLQHCRVDCVCVWPRQQRLGRHCVVPLQVAEQVCRRKRGAAMCGSPTACVHLKQKSGTVTMQPLVEKMDMIMVMNTRVLGLMV